MIFIITLLLNSHLLHPDFLYAKNMKQEYKTIIVKVSKKKSLFSLQSSIYNNSYIFLCDLICAFIWFSNIMTATDLPCEMSSSTSTTTQEAVWETNLSTIKQAELNKCVRCGICGNIYQARNNAQGQSLQYINIQHPSKIHNLFSIKKIIMN